MLKCRFRLRWSGVELESVTSKFPGDTHASCVVGSNANVNAKGSG